LLSSNIDFTASNRYIWMALLTFSECSAFRKWTILWFTSGAVGLPHTNNAFPVMNGSSAFQLDCLRLSWNFHCCSIEIASCLLGLPKADIILVQNMQQIFIFTSMRGWNFKFQLDSKNIPPASNSIFPLSIVGLFLALYRLPTENVSWVNMEILNHNSTAIFRPSPLVYSGALWLPKNSISVSLAVCPLGT